MKNEIPETSFDQKKFEELEAKRHAYYNKRTKELRGHGGAYNLYDAFSKDEYQEWKRLRRIVDDAERQRFEVKKGRESIQVWLEENT